jgi:hypothetical protein
MNIEWGDPLGQNSGRKIQDTGTILFWLPIITNDALFVSFHFDLSLIKY